MHMQAPVHYSQVQLIIPESLYKKADIKDIPEPIKRVVRAKFQYMGDQRVRVGVGPFIKGRCQEAGSQAS